MKNAEADFPMVVEGTESSPDEIGLLVHLQLYSRLPAMASQAAAGKKEGYSVQKTVVGADYEEGCPYIETG